MSYSKCIHPYMNLLSKIIIATYKLAVKGQLLGN